MNQNDKITIPRVETLIKKKRDESGSKRYQRNAANGVKNADYNGLEKEGTKLLAQVIEGRKEMHDYMTSSLARGGYYYRMICEIFAINTVTITFYTDEKIHIESPQKIIIFDNHKLQIHELIPWRG